MTQLDAGSKESTHNPLADAAPADQTDRYRQLCGLLNQVKVSGTESFEAEIDRIRQHANLSDAEREVVAKIFRQGFEAALRKADQHKTWAYQRLLRRLLVGQPLDCPILGDNPYVTLNSIKSPRSSVSSEANKLKGIFAAEESDGLYEPLLETAGAKRGGNGSHRRRIVYAIAINAVAVGLWLGPLNPRSADRAIELPSARDLAERGSSSTGSYTPLILAANPPGTAAEKAAAGESAGGDGAFANKNAPGGGASESPSPVPRPVEAKSVVVTALRKPARPASSAVVRAVQEIGLRNEPQHSAPKGEALPPGTRLEVIATEGSWLKVRCESDGKIGYVRKEFLEPITPET